MKAFCNPRPFDLLPFFWTRNGTRREACTRTTMIGRQESGEQGVVSGAESDHPLAACLLTRSWTSKVLQVPIFCPGRFHLFTHTNSRSYLRLYVLKGEGRPFFLITALDHFLSLRTTYASIFPRDSHFVRSGYEAPAVKIATWLLAVTMIIMVLSRLATKYVVMRKLQIDDYLIIIAMV